MRKLTKIFVYIKKDIFTHEKIKKNEVGIVEGELTNPCTIFFVISEESLVLPDTDFEVFDIIKTGDGFQKKVCNVCHRLLPTTQFSKNQNGKGDRVIRRPSCDDCRRIIDGVRVSSTDRRKWEQTRPEYEPFQCPICQKITIPSLTSKVVLDHDHTNGRVRGWICDSCNTGIGRFKDDISLLEKAIIYLKTK